MTTGARKVAVIGAGNVGATCAFVLAERNVGQVVLLDHPFRPNLRIIKRIQSIEDGQLFLVGDNPDPNTSEDSHNFGEISSSLVIAVLVSE